MARCTEPHRDPGSPHLGSQADWSYQCSQMFSFLCRGLCKSPLTDNPCCTLPLPWESLHASRVTIFAKFSPRFLRPVALGVSSSTLWFSLQSDTPCAKNFISLLKKRGKEGAIQLHQRIFAPVTLQPCPKRCLCYQTSHQLRSWRALMLCKAKYSAIQWAPLSLGWDSLCHGPSHTPTSWCITLRHNCSYNKHRRSPVG